MKKIIIILTAIVFITVLELNAQNSTDTGIQFEQTSWAEIVNKAKVENKLIFLDAYASWCGPCKYMAKNIFTNDEVAAYYNNNFINAKIDMEKGEGLELAKKYGVNAYPTFLFIDGNGNVMHQACGGKEATEFIRVGQLAFEEGQNTSAYINKFSTSELTASFMSEYIGVLSEACISTDKELDSYFSTIPAAKHISFDNASIILKFVKNYSNSGFQTMIHNYKDFVNITNETTGEGITKEQINKKIKEVFSYSFKQSAREKNKIEFEKIKRQIISSDLEFNEGILLKGDMYWAQYQKDWSSYASTAMKYVPKFAKGDYQELNSICWTFYENVEDKSALKKSIEWITASLEIKAEYANQDTYAALLYKLGMKDEALKAADLAIQFAQDEGADAQETLKLLDKIEALN